MRCTSCAAPAILDQPYRGAHVCGTHLAASIEERFRRAMHRQLPRFAEGTIAVGLSGGKDSAVALALSHRYFSRRPSVRLVAVSVDEGIAGYRGRTIDAASTLTRSLGIEHRIVRAREALGTTTDEAADRLATVPPCSYCGVWRRGLLNRAARDAGADAVVLGFNLDDLAQTVLMNLVHGEIDRLVRMAPHRARQPGLIPRVAPLQDVPEREVFVFARLLGLPFDHGECPHAARAARNRFREVVWDLEEAQPGTRQSLLRTQARLVDLLLTSETPTTAPVRCRACGEPAARGLCRSCEFLRIVAPPPPAPEAA